MGSKPRDSGQMATASAGADAASAAQAKLAGTETNYLTQAHDSLFGADGKNGSLTKFTDPNSLNVSSPTGPYGLQYNKALEGISTSGANARGSLSRYMASRGFGNAPAGFQSDELRKELADETNQKGAAFTDYTSKSYGDALSNFWNANNLMAGQGANSTSAAVQANNSAASNYSNLYGTASTPVPSALGSIVGGGLSAGGQVGAAAMGKPKT